MKFKIDENLPAEFALLLREAGHEADTTVEEKLAGASDAQLFELCRAESRLLLTLDMDFASIRAYPPGTHPGIVVFRSKSQDLETLAAMLKRLVLVLRERSPAGQLWIVEPGRVRIRN